MKKVLYQSKIADHNLAVAMDILSNEYRFREKMFPVKARWGIAGNIENDQYFSYKNLMEMASFALNNWSHLGEKGSFIDRYDENDVLIKRHIHRDV